MCGIFEASVEKREVLADVGHTRVTAAGKRKGAEAGTPPKEGEAGTQTKPGGEDSTSQKGALG